MLYTLHPDYPAPRARTPLPALRHKLFALVCASLLFFSACGGKNIVPPEPAKTAAAGPEIRKSSDFASLENLRITRLTADEARTLAVKLDPARQGMRSWNDLRFALEQSLSYVNLKPQGSVAAVFPAGQPGEALQVTWAELRGSLLRMLELLPYLDVNPGLLAEEFRWWEFSPAFGYTGYYEPTLDASYRPGPMYAFPLYSKPPDLQPNQLFFDRRAIDRLRVLAGRGLELAWVRDELDAYFLHIQGSGRLIFPDGSVKHVLYAGKNGRPYVSLGAVLRDRGLLDADNISMPSIRDSLLKIPEEKAALLDMNPSYVFFRLADDGPIGSMGSILTPQASLAVDPRVLPYGSLVFFNTLLPGQTGGHQLPLYALGLPQDSGGAIKGRRIDIFFGAGKAAEHAAGYLNQEGGIYLLLPAS
ncbi:MAG: MltA domain-containing protein [Deltaproteobacteria bacterium]|jgi:membrane-bound lytic murein transglycosylase A|nr:MltA domain-containing protein [Deltaproteobacteria bacterium]